MKLSKTSALVVTFVMPGRQMLTEEAAEKTNSFDTHKITIEDNHTKSDIYVKTRKSIPSTKTVHLNGDFIAQALKDGGIDVALTQLQEHHHALSYTYQVLN